MSTPRVSQDISDPARVQAQNKELRALTAAALAKKRCLSAKGWKPQE